MRKILIFVGLCVAFSIPLGAQDFPAVEVYGGYQLIHEDDFYPTWHGFIAAAEGNATSYMGIVGEFGFGFGSREFDSQDFNKFHFLIGPRFGYRAEKYRVFGHIMTGMDRLSGDGAYIGDASVIGSEKAFALAFGGGMDFSVSEMISIRPVQFDYLKSYFRFSFDQIRYSAGVVFKFGY